MVSLLPAKLGDLTLELRARQARREDLSDEEIENWLQLQELAALYDTWLESLRIEYEAGLAEAFGCRRSSNLSATSGSIRLKTNAWCRPR